MFDFVRHFLKVFGFNNTKFFDDFVLVNSEKFMCLDDGTFRQYTDF